MRATRAFLIGLGSGYLFDPVEGRRRRNVLRDRSLRALRIARRRGTGKVRFAEGRARGLAASVRRLHADGDVATDDATVTQRIRSDALRAVGVSTRDVEVEVEDGVATVRGSVPTRQTADALLARVAKVPGVEDVAAMVRITDRHAA
jgi:osmotically-inducible protein OsmY